MSQPIAQFGVLCVEEETVIDPDLSLMQRLHRGEPAAMTELVAEYGPRLHRLAGRLTGWNGDADDIVQDVFLIAWRRAGSYRGTGSLEGWLRRLVVNRCRNHRRARRAFERLVERAARLTRVTERTMPSNHHDLQQALQKLPSSDREVLVLFYLEQLRGDQVADVLRTSTANVHVRLHRARERLRQLYSDSENDER